jgi:hypothetical protein
MALVNANTYVEPTAATALTTARLQFNNSLRSLLTNFSSTAAPASINMTASGSPFNVPNGTLYRSETNHALYVADSDVVKNSPVGGNFTRIGLGNRVENGIVALGANAASYEIGELVATVSENGSLAANSRLYLVTSNSLTTGSTVNFLDIGATQGYSVGINDNVLFSGQQVLSPRIYATTNLAVGTTSPSQALTVIGKGVLGDATTAYNQITINGGHIGDGGNDYGLTINSFEPAITLIDRSASAGSGQIRVHNSGAFWLLGDTTNNGTIGHDTNTTDFVMVKFQPDEHIFYVNNGATEALRVTNAGNIVASGDINGVNITASGDINGVNITASGDINTTSDRRVKTNIIPIDNALAKTLQIEGVYYNRIGEDTRKVGVIAQDIEHILPEVVSGSDLKSVSYGNITGLLIEAIKELNKEVQELKSSIK